MQDNNIYLERVFELNPDGIILISSECIILKANKAFAAMVGLAPENIINQKCYDILKLQFCQTKTCIIKQLLNGKNFISKKCSINLATGGEIKISLKGFVCNLNDKETSDFLIYFRDISVQDKLMQDFGRSYVSNQVVLENNPLGIVILNDFGKVNYVNTAMLNITGFTLDKFLALNIFEFAPYRKIGLVEQIKECLEKKHFSLKNLSFEGSKGKKAIVDITGIPLDISAEKQVLLFVQDNTNLINSQNEKINLEKQLHQSQKLEALGTLTAGIAHELNTPIQFINDNNSFLEDSYKTFTELINIFKNKLIETSQNKEAILNEIKQIEETADIAFLSQEVPNAFKQSADGLHRVTKIVKSMRDFSHMEEASEKVKADINAAIEATITISKNEWKYIADIETNFAHDLPLTICFLDDIKQVILNIIINASHAIKSKLGAETKEKGKITITTASIDEQIIISVSDTGTGIDKEIRNQIYDPFFTTKPVGQGTGQGLSLAYDTIVRKHQGSIDFTSALGKGTTFIITLPISGKDLKGDSINRSNLNDNTNDIINENGKGI